MSNKIKLGFVGGGNDSLIGVLHKVAAVMFDRYEIVGGVFSSNQSINKATASDLGLDLSRVYNNYEEMAKVEDLEPLKSNLKGELTIVISEKIHDKKASQTLDESDKRLIKAMINKLSIKEITDLIIRKNEISKKIIYDYCLKIKNEK